MGQVSGAGEDRLSDGLDIPDSNSGLWVSGVDYIAGWPDAVERLAVLLEAIADSQGGRT